MATTSPTPRDVVFQRLEAAVGAIQDSEQFRRYLDVQARFHRYSWGNVALILAQRPDATMVAGFHAWLKLHRYVKKGERGITIIVPMRRKARDEDESDAADADAGTNWNGSVFFGTGYVFDVSQTDGEPLPQVEVPVLDGEGGVELFRQFEAMARRNHVEVHVAGDDEFVDPTMMGAYLTLHQTILVRQAAPLQMLKTLVHELAHHFSPRGLPREQSETVAEAVAYVVCAHFGHDTGTRSFPYIATWSQEQAVLKQVLTLVQRVSATIIDQLSGELANQTPEVAS